MLVIAVGLSALVILAMYYLIRRKRGRRTMKELPRKPSLPALENKIYMYQREEGMWVLDVCVHSNTTGTSISYYDNYD